MQGTFMKKKKKPFAYAIARRYEGSPTAFSDMPLPIVEELLVRVRYFSIFMKTARKESTLTIWNDNAYTH